MKTLKLTAILIIHFQLLINNCYAQTPVDSVGSGCALDFDGVNDRVEINDNNTLDVTSEITVECFAFLDSSQTQNHTLVAKWAWCPDENWGASGQSYLLGVQGGNVYFMVNRDGNFYHLIGTATAFGTIGKKGYYHIAATFKTKYVSLFVNGVKVLSDSLYIDTGDPTASFCTCCGSCVEWCRGSSIKIGWCGYPSWNYTGILQVEHIYAGRERLRIGSNWMYCGGSQISFPFNGQIDEVRIWNYARTQTEIQRDMCRKLTGNEPCLLGYWRFDDCGGSIATDASGNGNNGTLY